MKKGNTIFRLSIGIVAIFFVFIGTASADLTTGLVAYYPFNGNANDESGNGHNGTENGATLTTDRFGNANKAYSFDGIDDYIHVPYDPTFDISLTGFTVAVWFKANPAQNPFYDIIDKSHGDNGSYDDRTGWVIQSDWSGATIDFIYGTGSTWYGIGVNNSILDDQWHHFAATVMGTTMNVYLDGVLQGTNNFPAPPASNNRDLFIGKHYALGRYFHGLIDDIRIYNRALTDAEIIVLYNNSSCTDNDDDGYAVEGGECGPIDCNDSDPTVNPGATEVCDGVDNNCDGQIDEGGVCIPDLIISSLSVPSSANAGQVISISDTTKNQGIGAAGASTTKFYLSTDATYNKGDTYLGKRRVIALAADASSSGRIRVTIPAGTPAGSYYIIAVADADRVVTESNERNNNKTRAITIQ